MWRPHHPARANEAARFTRGHTVTLIHGLWIMLEATWAKRQNMRLEHCTALGHIIFISIFKFRHRYNTGVTHDPNAADSTLIIDHILGPDHRVLANTLTLYRRKHRKQNNTRLSVSFNHTVNQVNWKGREYTILPYFQ